MVCCPYPDIFNSLLNQKKAGRPEQGSQVAVPPEWIKRSRALSCCLQLKSAPMPLSPTEQLKSQMGWAQVPWAHLPPSCPLGQQYLPVQVFTLHQEDAKQLHTHQQPLHSTKTITPQVTALTGLLVASPWPKPICVFNQLICLMLEEGRWRELIAVTSSWVRWGQLREMPSACPLPTKHTPAGVLTQSHS